MLPIIRSSLKWKLVLFYTLAILLMMSAVSLVNYFDMKKNVHVDVERFSDAILTQANLNLSRYYDNYEKYFSLLSGSIDFSRWNPSNNQVSYDYFDEYRQTNERLFLPIANQHPEIISLTIYNQAIEQELLFLSPTNPHTSKYGYSFEDEPWLPNIQQSNRPIKMVRTTEQYLRAYEQVSLPVLTLVQKFSLYGQVWFIKFDIDLEPAQAILSNIHLGGASSAMIIDASGVIVAHSDIDRITTPIDNELNQAIKESASPSFLWKKTNEMVVFQPIENTNWTTVVYVPYPVVAQSIFNVRNNTLLITAISLFLSLLLVLVISTSVTKRLLVLRQNIRRIGMGQLHHKLPELGTDEIGEVGLAYNRMLDELKTTIQNLANTKIREQEAVQSALQSQIHSHFLYNALESINSLAHLAGQNQIRQVTVALSNLLRYTSNYKDMMVTIREEMTHVEDYILIMQSIYGEDVQCTFGIPDDLMDAPCLKAIVQPIVENSIKHGFESKGQAVAITVTAELEEGKNILMTITDNAGGFPEEMLERLNHQLTLVESSENYKQISRVGLLNVQNRFKLSYPNTASGITIGNISDHSGASVMLRFPYHTSSEETAR